MSVDRSGAEPKLIVVGSLNQDNFVYLEQFPEPGETVFADSASTSLGGKGTNQAVAAALLGARVSFVGGVGEDAAGAAARATVEGFGIDTTHLLPLTGAGTGAAYINVNGAGENTIVVSSGANALVGAEEVESALDGLLDRVTPGSVVLAQGELPAAVVDRAAAVALRRGARFVLNLAPVIAVRDETLSASDPLIVNEGEAAMLLARGGTAAQTGVELAAALAERHGTSVVVTLGAAGAAVHSGGRAWVEPSPRPTRVVDTTGAGDAFVGALVAALCRGLDLESAVRVGAAAGSYAVTSAGSTSSYATAAELPAWRELVAPTPNGTR
jgi:ribokinase